MSNLRLHLPAPRSAAARVGPAMPLGRHLVESGIISSRDLLHGLDLQRRIDSPLGEILIAEGLATPPQILHSLATQHTAQLVDLELDPPARALAFRLPVALCLEYRAVPWMRMGDVLLVATSRPHQFAALRRALQHDDDTMPILPVIADETQIKEQISRLYGAQLAQKAATRVPDALSCRSWHITGNSRSLWAIGAIGAMMATFYAAPLGALTGMILLAFIMMVATTLLKAAAFATQIIHKTAEQPLPFSPRQSLPYRLPKVSMLVPLLHEKEIAGALIKRLSKLTYPKSQLEVVLVLEAGDVITRQTLAHTALPPWISVIEVPEANRLTTKPRALNYALDFCQGSIVGVWDAEDAPEPDQIEKVVTRFQEAPPNVACLQGILDYYNSQANWLSRCFTIEYASWWRMILPGAARLGLVIPLGGTTLFFRRDILEQLSGWDAHNVTEDADLGVRLARRGYVTELLPTVTYEEANCRLWPWVRQRSRWLKGFLITWCVHMRNPTKLLAELGWLRFLGVQTMMFATFAQFALAPFLWTFWLTLLGLTHPIEISLGAPVLWSMVAVFIVAETLNLGLSLVAVSGKGHRHLMWWVFTTPLYFTLGTLAAIKALYEFVVSPFFWDKTEHGVTPMPEVIMPLAPDARPLA
jgi:cellulose synthase/poly-beta-1,6-N-acetylglucosamine synthase-like glycosyltransferase